MVAKTAWWSTLGVRMCKVKVKETKIRQNCEQNIFKLVVLVCCKLAQTVHGTMAWNYQLWRSEGHRSRRPKLDVEAEAGLCLAGRLQSVLNAAARLVYSRRTSEHTTPLLRDLHWLHVSERIQFRLCSGIPLCAWHSTGISVWQPAADIRDRRSSMSPLCWHHDTTSAVDSSGYP